MRHATYLMYELAWALPVIAVQWAVGWRELWRWRRLLVFAVLLSTAYLVQAQASFVRATPEQIRGRAVGVAASGIVAGQGVAMLGGGLLADLLGPSVAIAVSGAVGIVLATAGAVAWRRADAERRVQPAVTAVSQQNG